MRRGFASMLMGLSLLLASFAWAGYVMSSTVLDPTTSTWLLNETLADENVHAAVTSRVADGVLGVVPDTNPVAKNEAEEVAATALKNPQARAAVAHALVEAHLLGLQGGSRDDQFSAFELNVAAREALVAARPSLRRQVLANPLVNVRLPVSGLNWLAGLRAVVSRFAIVATALAIIGFATTFVVAKEPAPVIRRAALWILGSAAGWTVAGVAFNAIAPATAPSSYAVFTGLIVQFFIAMAGPIALMAAFGLGLALVSVVVPAIHRRRGANLLAVAGRSSLIPHEEPSEPVSSTKTDSDTVPPANVVRVDPKPGMACRLSAAWLEGHGYLDDARVAPFFANREDDTVPLAVPAFSNLNPTKTDASV